MKRFLRPRNLITALGLLAGLLGSAAPASAQTSVAVADAPAVVEGNNAVFDVALENNTGAPVNIQFTVSTANNTAVAPGDYAPLLNQVFGPFAVPPGGTVVQVPVATVADGAFEPAPNETFFLNIVAANVAINDGQGVGTIISNDPPPTVTINNVALAEGNAGTTAFNFTVTLSNPSNLTTTFSVNTADGTAIAADNPNIATDGDYQPITNGSVSFAPGVTVQQVTVNVNGDLAFEGNDTFFVNLALTAGQITVAGSDLQGQGTILNDDTPPFIRIGDVTAAEGNPPGSTTFQFPIFIETAGGQPSGTINPIEFDALTLVGTGTSADPASDYQPLNANLVIPGGTASGVFTVNVTVNRDTTPEANETFFVKIDDVNFPTAFINQDEDTATGTINNDDAPPTATSGNINVVEGTATHNTAVIAVNLASAQQVPVSVQYSVASGGTATAGVDYVPGEGTLVFLPGQTTAFVTVNTIPDTTVEPNETFVVTFSNPQGMGTPPNATVTILDDDAQKTLSISGPGAAAEGNAGASNRTFTVQLSQALTTTLTVDYTTQDGTAQGGQDYTPVTGTLTFAPGDTVQLIQVPVLGDLLEENNETFSVVLSNVSDAATVAVPVPSAQAVINDDDIVPVFTINDVSATEGNVGSKLFNFTVTLSSPLSSAVSVQYRVVNGTANGGEDFTPVTGTLTFQPGVTSQTIAVPVIGDLTTEPDETFFVQLFNETPNPTPGIVAIGDNSGTGTILNDDVQPTLSINDVQIVEGDSGTQNLAFTVTLSAAQSQAFSVQYRTADITAEGNKDYVPVTGGTLTFQPGVLTQTINIPIIGDLLDEANETFQVELFNLSTGTVTLADAIGIGTIIDNDNPPTVNISADQSLCENEGSFTFTVTLTAPSGLPITVPFQVLGSGLHPATPGVDFTVAPASPLTFAPGEVQKTITVTITDDNVLEFNEQFTITLGQPNPPGLVNVVGGDLVAVGTIEDNDGVQVIEVENISENGTTININGLPEQCFRATAYNGCGERVAGAALLFDVEGTTGSNNADKVVITDPNGVAEFCYTPLFAGTDTVTVSDTAPNAIATPVVVQVVISLPAFSTPSRVEGAGYINGANNTPASFSLNANVKRNGKATGNVNTDLFILGGLAKFRSTRIDRVIAGDATEGGHAAIIFGVGRVQGVGTVRFRVDVLDQVDPGVPGDRYVLTILDDASGDVDSVGGALKHARGKGIKNDIKIDGPGL